MLYLTDSYMYQYCNMLYLTDSYMYQYCNMLYLTDSYMYQYCNMLYLTDVLCISTYYTTRYDNVTLSPLLLQ
jgi:hypothetical protein